jgi:tRNA (guanine37-N1)-methyltransferase
MLQIAVITLFPEMFSAITSHGITGKAVTNGLLEVTTVNPRDFTRDLHRTVDDRPYGGGPGMIMMPEPLQAAISKARTALNNARVIYLSPQGRKLRQKDISAFPDRLILIAGRYEGIDERIIAAEIDEQWSIGDYVLSGGELPAMVLIDAMSRLQPGVLGHSESAGNDSFANGLLEHPHYTRPEKYGNMQVPEVLLSGDHAQIKRWRMKQALGRTWQRRPDLLDEIVLDDEQISLLEEFVREQT